MEEFSIIVPVYNNEKYLRQCLDSIRSQTYPHFEVILVDDGSADNSGRICDEYAEQDKRFKVIHQPNGGVTRARKTGIQNAKNEYIAWVDSDDYIGPDLLKNLHTITEEYAPDMIAFGLTIISNDGLISFSKGNGLPREKLYFTHDEGFFKAMIYDRQNPFGNEGSLNFELTDKVIKKEKICDCLLAVPDALRIGEDMAAVFTALQRCNTVYVSETRDYFYRLNDTSIMRTYKLDELRRHMVLFRFLSENRGKIPQENINAYMLKEILYHVISAIGEYDKYADFIKFTKLEITPDVRAIINETELPKCTVKQKILILLLKYYWYFGFWLIYHVRKKLIAKLKNILSF